MDFRLLGPLEVRNGGRPVPIAGPRQRALLAMLLLEADRVVPTARLLDTLWDEPPESGAKAVQMCVSELRRALGGSRDVLVTSPPGYRLRVERDAVDVHRFERMVSDARLALDAGEPARAAEQLHEALGLWRGSALAEFASERFAAAEAARLEALREEALELRIEAELALGRHAGLVSELQTLVVRYPLRERLRAQLMRALYRCGRQADALAVYQDARKTLVEELGIEPGPELQRLQQAILRQDPGLEGPERAPADRPADRPRPEKPPSPREERPTPAEERKLVTVLFADLTESTALGEQLDPERLRAILADYFQEMASVVKRWGGSVEKFIGDAVMAVFGIPAMREDDPDRALQAALDMKERLAALNVTFAERHGVELSMRIGLNTGEVIAAAAAGDQFLVTGDPVNVAARLQQRAGPDEILVGERTRAAAGDRFAFEVADELEVKGRSRPVGTWLLVKAGAAGPAAGQPAARFVGRTGELSLLETLFRTTVEERRPRLVTLLGHAGIGKTRLTEEFLSRTEATLYQGRCLSYGQGITYWALREILWNAAGILLGDASAVAAEKLETLVRGLPALEPDEADRVLFALATTAGIGLAENPLEELAAESMGEELALAWPRFLSALAESGPVVVVIEDLHWAEGPLLDMLERLAARVVGPVLIVATGRPELTEMRPGWSARAGLSQIALEPLTKPQGRELVEELVPGIGSKLCDRILGAAEGNPFVTEEIVRHLVETGSLGDEDISIPDSVWTLLAARIDTLPADEKRVLHDAAVVGRIFWAPALEAMGRQVVQSDLQGLEEKGLIVARPASALPGQDEFAFRHALIREVAYQSIPRTRRAGAHAAVAGWIEQLTGERHDEYVELIAHHYEAAAQPENAGLAWPDDPGRAEAIRARAIVSLLEAGRANLSRFAIEQAAGFAGRALSLAAADAERLAALELRANAQHAGVQADAAWASYREALSLAEGMGDLVAASRLRARATLLWARYLGAFTHRDWMPDAVEMVERGLAEAGEGTTSFEAGALLAGRSTFGFWGMAPRAAGTARRDAERAAEIAAAIDSPELLSYALDSLYAAITEEGFCGLADFAGRAADAARGIVDPWAAHELFVTAAIAYAGAGRVAEAAELAEQSALKADGLSPHHRLHAASATAMALLAPGRLADLAAVTGQAQALVEEEGGQTCYHGFMAVAAGALVAFETGDETALGRALDTLEHLSRTDSDREAFGARIAEFLRPARGAGETLDRIQRLPHPENPTAQVRHLRAELQARALAGGTDDLGRLVEEAREIAKRACAPALGWIAAWAEAFSRGDGQAATEACAGLADLGERYTAGRLLVDALPVIQNDARPVIARDVAAQLEAMGAQTSARQARAAA